MPTATTLSGATIFNLGPLTSTFTAPSSCASKYDTWIVPASGPTTIWNPVECTFYPVEDCFPSSAARKSHFPSSVEPTPGMAYLAYYSPGLVCPSGWETVGVAEKVSPSSTSMSGIFSQENPYPTSSVVGPLINPDPNIFMGALDPDETAIVCCPSSYTAHPSGFCLSALPTSEPKPESSCVRTIPKDNIGSITATFPLYGETITAEVFTFTGTEPPVETTSKISSDESSTLILAAEVAGITLVYKASDSNSAGGGEDGGDGGDGGSGGETNAAVPGARMPGAAGGLGAIITVCCVAMAAGAMLMVPS